MSRVIILFGFCTAGKSTILNYLKKRLNKDNLQIIDVDTDFEISKEYGNHIYNIYISFYRERGDGKENIKDALEYIEKKEREILIKLTDECSKSDILYIIAPGPFLVTRKPEWSDFRKKVKPICYYLELTPEEVYDGLIKRRKKLELEFEKIGKPPSFGCWDYCVMTEFRDGIYKPLKPKIAVEHIKEIMCAPCAPIKIYEGLSSKDRTFKAREIRKKYLKNKLYNSIKKDLSLKDS